MMEIKENRGSKWQINVKQSAGYKKNRDPRFHTYTPLNVDRREIMDEALNVDLIPTFRKLQSPKGAYTFRQCPYYCNFGHTTEECPALKDKIEELIQVDHLRKIIQGTNKNFHRYPKREKYPRKDERRESYSRCHHNDD